MQQKHLSLIICFFLLIPSTIYAPLVASPPAFVFELDGGANFFTGDTKTTEKRHNLEKLRSKVALSFNIKSGVLFKDHYLTLLSFSYDRLRDFNYQLGALVNGAKHQHSYKKYSIGIDSVFFIFPYRNKYNIAFSIDNHAAMLFNRISRIDTTVNTASNGTVTETITRFYSPVNVITYEYLLRPEIKFHLRLTEISTLYLAFSYSILMPSFLHYPSLVIGMDIHFDLIKDQDD